MKDNKEFINDVIFIKEMIKNLEDTVYYYYPKRHFDILPFLHKAYDNMTFILYKAERK